MAPRKTTDPAAKPVVSKPPARKRALTEKAKALQKAAKKGGAKTQSAEDSSDDSELDELAEPGSKPRLDVDWKDPQLSVELLMHILENKDIKQALFPPCGPNASTTNGGGKKKIDAQWKLAFILLSKIEKYKEALAAVSTPKEKRMARITRACIEEMGGTGAGIQTAADIDMSVTNTFTTKWGAYRSPIPAAALTQTTAEIDAAHPWFFEMRELIGQRPNLIPTGLGRSSTGVDAGVIIADPAAVNVDDVAPEEDEDDVGLYSWPASPEPDSRKRTFSEIDEEIAASGDDFKPSSPVPSESAADVDDGGESEDGKGKGMETEKKTQRKPNPAKPSTSTPAALPSAAPPKPSKKTKVAEFAELAKNEEKTRQKELEFAALRTRQAIKTTEVKGRIEERREERRMRAQEGKREERMMKLKMKELKIRNAHELRMSRASTSSSHADSFFDSHSSSGSHSCYAPSDPSEYTEFDGFHENAVAASSTSASMDFADISAFNSFADSVNGSQFNNGGP
ncbi:hypothetical protein C8R43DRAFT_962832 [Mycena crocata]|nr:hypothetical protein C8R43DRAFT_962832 [Mycena crocata]